MPVVFRVAQESSGRKTIFLDESSKLMDARAFSRESVVFPLFAESIEPGSFKSGTVYLLYTADPYRLISALSSAKLPKKFREGLWISHGMAAVIAFVKGKEDPQLVPEYLKGYCFAIEKWTVSNKKIVESSVIQNNKISSGNRFKELDSAVILSLDDAESVLVTDIYLTLRQIEERSHSLGTVFSDLIGSTIRLVHELLLQIIYLEDKLSDQQFADLNSKFVGISDSEDLEDLVNSMTRVRKRGMTAKVEKLQTLRDRLVQVRACLKYLYRQGFTCFPPLLESDHPSGTHSLLGFAACTLGLHKLYSTIQTAVSSTLTLETYMLNLRGSDRKIERSKRIETDPNAYVEWVAVLEEMNPVIPQEIGDTQPAKLETQLSYFSSRLGFKATEVAVTASSESISYCDRPAWHLTTLFHEYVHLFVKPVFLELNERDANDAELFETYKIQFSTSSPQPVKLQLFDLLKLSYWRSSYLLREIEKSNFNGGSKIESVPGKLKDLYEAVENTQKDSEEIIVQTLEHAYFYQNDPALYIKSIWSSWLSLPATYNRKLQYLLRSILAISIEFKGHKEVRFEKSISLIENALGELSGEPGLRSGAPEEIVEFLANDDVRKYLHSYFFKLVEFSDVSAHLLVNTKLRSRLFKERGVVPDQEGIDYLYGSGEATYYGDMIESPVNFLVRQLKKAIGNTEDPNRFDNSERNSLWIYHMIGSSDIGKTKP